MTKYKDNNTYGQNNTNYAPPAGIVGPEAVKEMQRWLGGLTVDGIWGPKTQKQFDKAMAAVLKTTELPPAPADRERLSYAEDLYKLSLGIGKSGLGNYMARGYDPPGNIKSAEDVRAFQESHGLDVDGIWAGRTQRKHDQLQQQWAGQYDPDEITRLVVEGLSKLAGAGERAFLEGTIPLRGGSAQAGQIMGAQAGQAGGGTTAQIMGVQAGAKPATLGGAKQEEILQGRPIEKPDKYFQAQSNQKPPAQSNVILQPDDEGIAVENVQRWLEQLGFLDMSVSMDKQGNKQYGFYGGATYAAVMFYQFNYGFDMTGELDSRQYLNIYNGYLHEAGGQLQEKVDAYYNMVNTAITLDEEKGYRYTKYPTYYDLPKRKPSLPSSMKEAGIEVVEKDGLYYMDYTEPLLRMMEKNIGEAAQVRKSNGDPGLLNFVETISITEDLAWFYFMVKPGAVWDIKEKNNWKKQFPGQTEGVKFFHHSYPFVFLGDVVTAEDMGNILFGATGAAMGFGQELLKWAGATPNIVDDVTNLFRSYFGDNDRDLEKIEYGIRFYSALQENGSASLIH